jgi:hypothetical protein
MAPSGEGRAATLERVVTPADQEVAAMGREQITITVDPELLARAAAVAKTRHPDTVVEFALRDLIFRHTPEEVRRAAIERLMARSRELEFDAESEDPER